MTNTSQKLDPGGMKALKEGKGVEKESSDSLIASTMRALFITPPFITSIAYINIGVIYLMIVALAGGFSISPWYGLIYPPLIYMIEQKRKSIQERERAEVAHRIPFFTDALANALSVGSTLEQSFQQASYYLKGKIKQEFEAIIVQSTLGKNLGQLLRGLDAKFPNTGLTYIISLLEAYSQLGIGISPLLKRVVGVLTEKERAEGKVKTILSGGSSYAKVSVGIFGGIFLIMSFVIRDRIGVLLSPELRPKLIFLLGWTFAGIMVVTRISSLSFTRAFALKPYIANYLKENTLTEEQLMHFSGFEWSWWHKKLYQYAPLLGGGLICYIASSFTTSIGILLFIYLIGVLIFQWLAKRLLKSLFEDELMRTIEVFPDILQVFIIGLNSGLNTYLAFQFAQNALKGSGTKILTQELTRTKFAMECGEDHSRTWQVLAQRLPFEVVVDFCEIMVVSPMAGESIVGSIIQMTESHQDKKLKLIEQKANTVSQLVIPLIIVVFFPLFLFSMFGPIIFSSSLQI